MKSTASILQTISQWCGASTLPWKGNRNKRESNLLWVMGLSLDSTQHWSCRWPLMNRKHMDMKSNTCLGNIHTSIVWLISCAGRSSYKYYYICSSPKNHGSLSHRDSQIVCYMLNHHSRELALPLPFPLSGSFEGYTFALQQWWMECCANAGLCHYSCPHPLSGNFNCSILHGGAKIVLQKASFIFLIIIPDKRQALLLISGTFHWGGIHSLTIHAQGLLLVASHSYVAHGIYNFRPKKLSW